MIYTGTAKEMKESNEQGRVGEGKMKTVKEKANHHHSIATSVFSRNISFLPVTMKLVTQVYGLGFMTRSPPWHHVAQEIQNASSQYSTSKA